MSIERESNGLPEVDVHRRTTKVSLSVIVAVLVFFAVAIGFGMWLYRGPAEPVPASPTMNSGAR